MIFDASPNAPKIRKIGARRAQEAATRPRGFAEESTFGDLGPWGGHARDKILDTKYKVQRYKGTKACWPVGKRECWLVRTGNVGQLEKGNVG